MTCCGDREKGEVSMEEKWDYINLEDFKSESCMTVVSYIFVYVFLLISIAVYAVDIFTAVNLLAFSHWAGQIRPAIPFTVSRWIFAVCILISFALLIIRWLRAIRAIRSGSISRSYLDSLAVRIQSIRMGSRGRGWKRFLVFAELTKSKRGAEYVALYSYFAFETWMNILLADGPRQVVNAITLWSVMRLDLLPGGNHAHNNDKSPALQFFDNIKIMADHNSLRAVVFIGMVFTVFIWILSVLKLASAVVLYLLFLFHHIPAEDGTLNVYCRRKIRNRLRRIVARKVDKALAKGYALQERTPTEPNLLAGEGNPTLPSVGKSDMDKGPSVTVLSRSTTQTTLPPYTSRPGTAASDRNPTLPNVALFGEKPPLSRTATESSEYSESVSLGGNAVTASSPLDRQNSPAPPVPPIPMAATRSYSPVSRPPTSQSRFTPGPPAGPNGPGRSTPGPGYGGPSRADYNSSPMGRPNPTPPPGPNGPGRSTPGPEYGGPSRADYNPSPMGRPNPTPPPGPNGPGRFTPGPGYGGSRPIDYNATPGPYRPYSPSTNSHGRSLTPARNFSRVGHSATSLPGHQGGSFTPAGQEGTPQPQKLDRYAAFDPLTTSHTPPPRNQAQTPAYDPYDRNASQSRSPQPHF